MTLPFVPTVSYRANSFLLSFMVPSPWGQCLLIDQNQHGYPVLQSPAPCLSLSNRALLLFLLVPSVFHFHYLYASRFGDFSLGAIITVVNLDRCLLIIHPAVYWNTVQPHLPSAILVCVLHKQDSWPGSFSLHAPTLASRAELPSLASRPS